MSSSDLATLRQDRLLDDLQAKSQKEKFLKELHERAKKEYDVKLKNLANSVAEFVTNNNSAELIESYLEHNRNSIAHEYVTIHFFLTEAERDL